MRPTRCQVRCCRLRKTPVLSEKHFQLHHLWNTKSTSAVGCGALQTLVFHEHFRKSNVCIRHQDLFICLMEHASLYVCACVLSLSCSFSLALSLSLSLLLSLSFSVYTCRPLCLPLSPLFLSILFVSTALTPDTHGDASDNDRLLFAELFAHNLQRTCSSQGWPVLGLVARQL